jgi:hypothetical protein
MLEIYVVPVVNVDGHDVVTSGEDPRWRKNRRDANGDGKIVFREGVDLNRNYDFNLAHGGSGDPQSERYRGEFPFSESEARAIAALAREKRFLCSLTYRSQGEVIFYPWDWGGRKAPDDRLLTALAHEIPRSIRTMRGDTCYRAEYGAGLVGQSYPWLYGVMGTTDFVVETGRGASFPPAYEVEGIVRANLPGISTLLQRAEGPGLMVRVKEKTNGSPLEAEVWLLEIETGDLHRRTCHPFSGMLWGTLVPGKDILTVAREGCRPSVVRDVPVGDSGRTTLEVGLERAEEGKQSQAKVWGNFSAGGVRDRVCDSSGR